MKTKCTLTNATTLIKIGASGEYSANSGNRLRRYVINALFASLIFPALYFGSVSSARADVSSCSGRAGWTGIAMRHETYFKDDSPASDDLRATTVDGHRRIRLRGWLYYPEGKAIKDYPVLIFNHGSGEEQSEPCEIARYFVKNGFIVFAPLRRGNAASRPDPAPAGWEKIQSSGTGTDEFEAYCMNKKCGDGRCMNPLAPFCNTSSIHANYLQAQTDEVSDQLNFMRSHDAIGSKTGKLADPKRITLLGHSYGGVVTVFANARFEDKHSVAIDISGAEMSWTNEVDLSWGLLLSSAMYLQKRPIYFLQPKNGRTLVPTKVLFEIGLKERYRSQAAIFPPSPCFNNPENGSIPPPCDESVDPAWRQAHITFANRRQQVETWAPSVREFINRYPLPSK